MKLAVMAVLVLTSTLALAENHIPRDLEGTFLTAQPNCATKITIEEINGNLKISTLELYNHTTVRVYEEINGGTQKEKWVGDNKYKMTRTSKTKIKSDDKGTHVVIDSKLRAAEPLRIKHPLEVLFVPFIATGLESYETKELKRIDLDSEGNNLKIDSCSYTRE